MADKELASIRRSMLRVAFRKPMDDDFNTPVAICRTQNLRSEVNSCTRAADSRHVKGRQALRRVRFGRLVMSRIVPAGSVAVHRIKPDQDI